MKIFIRLWQTLRPRSTSSRGLSDFERAIALIDALDRGGVVSDPIRVNAIARSLGLDVSRRAELSETIQRIRAVIARAQNKGYD